MIKKCFVFVRKAQKKILIWWDVIHVRIGIILHVLVRNHLFLILSFVKDVLIGMLLRKIGFWLLKIMPILGILMDLML
jgi:hypothetical protein